MRGDRAKEVWRNKCYPDPLRHHSLLGEEHDSVSVRT
jgi:hypothetical protein